MKPINHGKTLETLVISKDTYKKLKWLQSFLDKGKYAIEEYMFVYVIGASLVATDGNGLARIDVPEELKKYCHKVKYFTIVKLTTNPYIAILDDISPTFTNKIWEKRVTDRASAIASFIDKTKSTTEDENRVISVGEKLLGKLATMPTDENSVSGSGRLDIYVEDSQKSMVVVTKEAFSIIMARFHPNDDVFSKDAKLKLSEKGKALVESAGMKVNPEEYGEETPAQNIEEKDPPESK